MRAIFRSALVALSAYFLLGTLGFAQAVDPFERGVEADRQGDYAEAVKWFLLAAEQGHVGAQFNLGKMNSLGEGVPKNASEAAKWYRLAAEQGDAEAQVILGTMYAKGEGVPEDYVQAYVWFNLAAAQGDADAQLRIGLLYQFGRGVTKNPILAAKWYRLAAEQGKPRAQAALGNLYFFGEGVPKNIAEAFKWHRLAAEQGDLLAQRELGTLYFRGEGVPEDYVQAYKWWNLAAAQGDALAAEKRDALREDLTPAQLAEAQKQSSAEMGRGREPERRPPAASNDVKATGSAFLVSGIGDLVTNAHVVSDCRRLTLADGTLLTSLAYEPASDLALLRSPSLAGRPALPLRSGKGIRLADSVIVAGFPLTGIVSPDLNVTTGNVSALSGPDGNRALFQITAPVQSGNSGGPVLDQAGNLVGVVVSKLDALLVANLTGDLPQNVNFGISLGTLQTFLDANNVDYSSQPATRELANASIAEAAKSATFQIVCY